MLKYDVCNVFIETDSVTLTFKARSKPKDSREETMTHKQNEAVVSIKMAINKLHTKDGVVT